VAQNRKVEEEMKQKGLKVEKLEKDMERMKEEKDSLKLKL
jgi:hypothetical protein